MKKAIFILPLVLLLFGAVLTQGFGIRESINEQGQSATRWYEFVGSDPTDIDQLLDNTLYELTNSQPCAGQAFICAVKAEGSDTQGDHPDSFSKDLEEQIRDVLQNPMAPAPDVSFRN